MLLDDLPAWEALMACKVDTLADLVSVVQRPAWAADGACREHPETRLLPPSPGLRQTDEVGPGGRHRRLGRLSGVHRVPGLRHGEPGAGVWSRTTERSAARDAPGGVITPADSVLAVTDEFAHLRQKRPCAAQGCVEEVGFSLFTDLAVREDEPKYHGKCANGHRNVLTSGSAEQWVEDEDA